MAHINDFEPIIPDPQPYIVKALALYERVVRDKRGRVVFITSEVGGGKTELLSVLAKSLREVKHTPGFIAGYFKGGEYNPYQLDSQRTVRLNTTLTAVGEIGSLLGMTPTPFAFAASFIGQLLKTSVSAREFGAELQKKSLPVKESAEWLRNILRRAVKDRPLVCLLDDWDEAQRFNWDSMLVSLSKEIAKDVPLLLLVTVTELVRSEQQEDDSADLKAVISSLTEKGLAELWPLRKLSHNEVATFIGEAVPGITAKLHGVTGGNARWVRELWREWRLNETVVIEATAAGDRWVWGERHKATVNLYDDILRDRLTRLLNAKTVMEVEEARGVLACAALEGERFTVDAVARAVGWDRDDLIDFFDEVLVQSEDNPNGLLLEEGSVSIPASDGTTRTLWRYSFVSDLHWMALKRYGLADELRPGRGGSEKLEMSAALANALTEVYGPEERLVAAPLARLLRDIGHHEAADHYQRMAEYAADSDLMREHALYLLSLNKERWEQWECGRTAKFLIEAGRMMVNRYPFDETMAVFEEACGLARRAKHKSTEAWARYQCGFLLHAKGDIKAARESVDISLNIFRHLREKNGIVAALHLLSSVEYVGGRYAESKVIAAEGIKVAQESGNRLVMAALLSRQAEIDFGEGHHIDARTKALHSLQINEEIGNSRGTAFSLNLLAKIDGLEGRYADARIQAAEALEIRRRIGDQQGVATSLHVLAKINYAEGRYAEARIQEATALRLAQELGDQRGIATSLNLLGNIAYKIMQTKEAVELLALSALIHTRLEQSDAQRVKIDLANVMTEQNYDEVQQQELFRQVIDAYRTDGGRCLIEGALKKMQESTD